MKTRTPIAPLWELVLMALARPGQRLSTWLWRRRATRAIERRNRLNTPWTTASRTHGPKGWGRAP